MGQAKGRHCRYGFVAFICAVYHGCCAESLAIFGIPPRFKSILELMIFQNGVFLILNVRLLNSDT
jgi:hypothetical protein